MTKWKEYFKNSYSKIIELFYGQMASFIDIDGEIKSRTYNPICFSHCQWQIKKHKHI